MPPPNMALQEKLRTYKAPRWGYRADKDGEIEKELFDTDLPPGWADSPAGFAAPMADVPTVSYDTDPPIVGLVSVPAAAPAANDKPKFMRMKKDELAAAAAELGVGLTGLGRAAQVKTVSQAWDAAHGD